MWLPYLGYGKQCCCNEHRAMFIFLNYGFFLGICPGVRLLVHITTLGFSASSAGKKKKKSACNAEDLVSISGSGKYTGQGIGYLFQYSWASMTTVDKESVCNGSIPGLGRSPGGGQDNPPQYSCLENPHGWRSLTGCSP